MNVFKIESSAGVEMGTWVAESPEAALDALARGAGYADHEAACKATGQDPADWTSSVSRFQSGGVGLLVVAV